MLKIGLTGNIGSGKTRVCKIFEALNIAVFYADLEARKILNSSQVIEELSYLFGSHIVNRDLTIDRKKLADIVFNDQQELQKLNNLIHPKLKDHFLIWSQSHLNHPYVIQEAAILFENGFDRLMDFSITVAASQEIRLKRVMTRDQASQEEVLARMNHQWSDEEKEKAADFIINNDGQEMLLPQILNLHQQLIQRSR